MQYSAQLHHKALHIEQLLQRVGKFSAEAVQAARREPVAAEGGGQYGYRNKVQLAFSSKVWVEDETAAAAAGAAHAGEADTGGCLQADTEESAAAGAAATTGVSAAAAAAAGVVRAGRVVDGWGLGFYLPGSNSVVMPVKECSLVVSQCFFSAVFECASGRPC
jgi:hypothetical protein